MQSIALSIPLMGPSIHWTADIMEWAHITIVKIPATMTNNIDFESQICRHLDHFEKCHGFSHALHLRENDSSGPKTDIDSDCCDTNLEASLEDDASGSFEGRKLARLHIVSMTISPVLLTPHLSCLLVHLSLDQ